MPDEPLKLLQFLDSQKQSGDAASATPVDSAAPAQQPAQSPTNAALLAPLSQQAAASSAALNASPVSVSMQGNLSWFDRNQRKDEQGNVIPIDTSSGIDLKDFARMVWQRRPEDRVQVLQKIFPGSLVREADTGDLIVEVRKPGEPAKDVLVNPLGFNPEDFIQAAEQSAAPTVAGTVGMLAGEALGTKVAGAPGGAIGKVAGAAIGSGIGGAITDLTARGAEDIPLDLREVATEQGKNAAVNALFDVGLFGGAKALRGLSPFAGTRGPLQFKLAEAKKYFSDNYGINFKTTPAEESGSQLLGRLERTESQLPGASGVLGDLYKGTQKDLADIFDAATGGRLSDDQLGQKIVPTIKSKLVDPSEQEVQRAKTALMDKGETEIADVIGSLYRIPATKKAAGDTLREEFKGARDAAKTATDAAYATVRSLPGGSGKALSGDPVALAADRIMADLPSAGGNTLSSGRPDSLMTTLRDMQSQRGQLMSLDELTKLKNSARDEIAKTEAVPGVKDRWFAQVSDAYDKAIDAGVQAAGGTPLKDALDTARNTYKTQLLPFDREGLHDILRTEYETGFKSPEQLVNRLFSGERADYNYRTLRDTLGGDSKTFKQIRNSFLNGKTASATDPITGRINPSKLESSLLSLREEHPEIYADVVGSQEKRLFEATASLRAARKEITDVDPEELAQLMRSGSVAGPQIERLMLAQKNRDNTLANGYLKSLQSGKPTTATPSEFVSSLFNSNVDNRYLSEVLGSLTKDQTEDLQRAALYRALTKASDSKVDMARYLSGQQSPFQANAMAKALGPLGSEELARNQMLLGPKYMELVTNAMGLLAPREEKTGLFKAAGSMAATGILQKLLNLPLQYMETWAKKAIASSLYVSEPFKNALINAKFGPKETAALANTLIASEPFIKAMNSTFGHDAAFSIALDAKHSIDQFVRQNTQPTAKEAQQGELMRFLQTQKGKVKLNPK